MASNKPLRTIFVALSVCIVCSVMVSASAVILKERQDANKNNSIRQNILIAAGLLKSNDKVTAKEINKLFKQIKTEVIDFKTSLSTDKINVETYDLRAAFNKPELSYPLQKKDDIAGIKRMVNYGKIYTIYDDNKLNLIILPIKGYGLWSTLYGFLALEKDLNTIKGITFYEHNETPGLGGEIDNPNWKALWIGRKLYKDNKLLLKVIKGKADNDPYKVDGLSGATLTSRGVSSIIQFWFSESGYQNYLFQKRATIENGAKE